MGLANADVTAALQNTTGLGLLRVEFKPSVSTSNKVATKKQVRAMQPFNAQGKVHFCVFSPIT